MHKLTNTCPFCRSEKVKEGGKQLERVYVCGSSGTYKTGIYKRKCCTETQ